MRCKCKLSLPRPSPMPPAAIQPQSGSLLRLAPFSPLAPNTRTLRVISWDSTRGRDDMVLTDTSAGRNITRVYAALMNPANFGPEGVIKCAPGISYVNAIPTGSLVNGGVRQADVFFGNMINPNSPVPLSASEAAELVAFLNAGGVVYISGDGHGQGTPWNPLFVALGISDRFASDYITSGSVSLPLVVTPLTNGPFGTVGYIGSDAVQHHHDCDADEGHYGWGRLLYDGRPGRRWRRLPLGNRRHRGTRLQYQQHRQPALYAQFVCEGLSGAQAAHPPRR